jgi:peptide/nickel transport system substrate-binding protein
VRRSTVLTGTLLTTTLLAAALALTACTQHPASQPAGGCPPDSSCDNPSSAGWGPVHLPGAVRGGTVTVLTHDGLTGTLDPSVASAPDVVSLLSGLVTRSLTQYRYDQQSHQSVLVPDLATDLGSHNDYYTKWILTLRAGVTYEDGAKVRATDVARGIRRCFAGPLASTGPCRDHPGILRRVHAEGRSVRLDLFGPLPELPWLAAYPALGPVPRAADAHPAAYARHPLATGPYQVDTFRPGRRLVLVRNPRWDPHTDLGRTQYPEEYDVHLGVAPSRIAAVAGGDTGDAATTLTYDRVPVTPADRGHSRAHGLVLGPDPCTTYLAPDNRTITDPEVRRALVWAYPYAAVLRAEGLVPGTTAVPATNLLPPGVAGRTAYHVPGHSPFTTDPARAHRMLARAHALGTVLRFAVSPDRAGLRTRDALVRALRSAGFDPRPVSAAAGSPVDLHTTTWCGAYPDGGAWLAPVYTADGPGGADQAAFSQPSVDRRIQQIRHLPLEQMGEAWNRLDHHVLRRWSPIVPLWYGGVAMAHGTRIEGMADDSVLGMPTWKSLWVSP